MHNAYELVKEENLGDLGIKRLCSAPQKKVERISV